MDDYAPGDLLICTSRVNKTEGYRFYEEREPVAGTIFEDYDIDHLAGAVYRFGLVEYGRCTGKVYVDRREGTTVHTGYVFEKRERYEDTGDTYLCETWVTVERVIAPAQPTTVDAVAL